MSDKLRWGILGAARVNERLLPAIVEAPNSQLVAIASRRPGAAAEILQKYAPAIAAEVVVHGSLEALINDTNVQAIYIPLANEEHGEWAVRAISAGKHVLIEKPMAITLKEIDAIAEAAAKHKVKVMEGFMYRFHPQHQRVQDIVRSGLIGEVRYAKASYSFMMRPARLYRLARDPNHGGGAMWDVGPYAVHSLRHCFDEDPVSVTAMAKYVESGADIATSGIIDFGNGKRGHFDISFECSRQSEYTIIGTKGGVKCHTVWQLPGTNDVPVISWWTEEGRKAEEIYPASNHFNLEIEHFSDCVLRDMEPALSLRDARLNCMTVSAILESASTGKVVMIT